MTLGHEIRTIDAKNGLKVLITWATLGRELKTLNTMNNARLWLT